MRTLNEIKRDLRACLSSAAFGVEVNDREIVQHFEREARAMERELELRKTGRVLSPAVL